MLVKNRNEKAMTLQDLLVSSSKHFDWSIDVNFVGLEHQPGWFDVWEQARGVVGWLEHLQFVLRTTLNNYRRWFFAPFWPTNKASRTNGGTDRIHPFAPPYVYACTPPHSHPGEATRASNSVRKSCTAHSPVLGTTRKSGGGSSRGNSDDGYGESRYLFQWQRTIGGVEKWGRAL